MRILNKTRLALLASIPPVLFAGSAQAETFNIPAEPLEKALDAYSAQTGISVMVANQEIKGIRTRGVSGNYPVDAALARILRGTGFESSRDPSGSVGIKRIEQNSEEVRTVELAQAAPVHAAASVETVVVTSSKIKGDIQTVPIAITALSQEQLTSRQIAGGPDLVKEVPNLTFSKTNFTGYNIEIRGIGTQAISVTTDPAVAVAFNDTPFIRNHFFEQEFYDVSQVEVLRGPQGTLYGRNATAGVVNVVSARPTDQFEAMLSADWGNYNNRRYEGMVNLPIVSDKLDLRIAGEWTKRDGYSFNEVTDKPIDGRDLWSSRMTLRWHPVESVTADFIWEHFSENDDRIRSGKQLCARSTLPAEIGGVAVPDTLTDEAYLTQGCKAASLYSPDSFQTPNSKSLAYYGGLSGSFGAALVFPLNYVPDNFDVYASATQSRNLRVIASNLNPTYKAKNDTLEFNTQWNVTPSLTFYSDTGYNRDFLWSTEDYNRFATRPETFGYDTVDPHAEWFYMVKPDGNYICANGTYSPGGNNCANLPSSSFPTAIFCDPQLGCATSLEAEDLSDENAWQFSQEFRMASDFKGPFNFSAGGNYMHYETEENYYVFINSLTMYSSTYLTNSPFFPTGNPSSAWTPGNPLTQMQMINDRQYPDPFGFNSPTDTCCGWIDPNPIGSLDNEGHNYFLSQNPYTLNSYALFGEVYYNLTNDLKLTGGLRWTDDQKRFIEIPSELLTKGYGYPSTGVLDQEWKKFTGRMVASWTPKLAFTDQSMFYASYAHGYKAGGANPPGAVLLTYGSSPGDIGNPTHPKTFKPEFNDAFELGTKNTAFDGALTLNGDVFYYDYKGYQISQIVDRTAINLNFDATVKGAEIQANWEAAPGLKFGFAGGYEDARLAKGSQAIDLMDRTAGNPNWVVVKPFVTQASNCVLPAYVIAEEISLDGGHGYPGAGIATFCGVAYNLGNDPLTDKPYTTDLTGAKTANGFSIPAGSYPGFDPLAGQVDPTTGTVPDPYTGQNIANGIDYGPAPNNGTGFYKNLSGNQLPNAPHFTTSFTADYTMPVSANWAATLHGDFYWQSQSYARVFNDRPYDKLRGYSNVNAALILTDASGWQVMGYVKNIFNTTAITGDFLNSDDTALTTNVFLTDPRLYGVRVTKNFDAGGGGFDLFSGADGKRPQVWLTLGGNFSMFQDNWQHYDPVFASFVSGDVPSPNTAEHSPSTGFDWEGKLSYQPENSDWVLKAGIRYGRSGTGAKVHKSETTPRSTVGHLPPTNFVCKFLHQCTLAVNEQTMQLVDTKASASERHTILDFTVGKNIGIGLFGSDGTSTVGAGVRAAQFDTRADADPEVEPIWVINTDPSIKVSGIPRVGFIQTIYDGTTSELRNFHGIGPELTWDANQPVLGTPSSGQVTLDWGVNAAMLFGRQNVRIDQTTIVRNIYNGAAEPADNQSLSTQPYSRSRSVTVPNLGGYVGASVRYQNAKISLGYRADEFFNAMDGGQATAKNYDRGFYGPYLNLSIGFGG